MPRALQQPRAAAQTKDSARQMRRTARATVSATGAATTATANDRAFAHLATMRWQPAIRTLPPYYDDPAYIDALADSVRGGLAARDLTPDTVMASFHGMPQRTLALGDPYHCHCQKTGRLLGEAPALAAAVLALVDVAGVRPRPRLPPLAAPPAHDPAPMWRARLLP